MVLVMVPAEDAYLVIAWGVCLILAGLYLTRRPRDPRSAAAVTFAVATSIPSARAWPSPPPVHPIHRPPIDHPPTGGPDMPEIPPPDALDATAVIDHRQRGDDEVGKLDSGEHPVLEAKTERFPAAATVNFDLARRANGVRCVRIDLPGGNYGFLSAAEARRLADAMHEAALAVGDLRERYGFES